MEWPSMKTITLINCDNLNRLFLGQQSAPNLAFLDFEQGYFEKMIWVDDQTAGRFEHWDIGESSSSSGDHLLLYH